ncbi:3'-5' exonuclease [candidate division WOR-3 bacterium]|nr:3'-5' exonuclease [candidate division WOR-3 bacterium]
MNIDKVIFCAVDTETTGLYPHFGDKLCEIGAVRFTLSRDISEFTTLVNPGVKLSRTIRYITGITDKMLHSAPSLEKIEDEIFSFIDESVLVFHNAPFDLSFLQYELNRRITNITVDTLILARRKFRFASNRLGEIATTMGIEPGRPHRAIDDARTVSKIAKEMIKKLEPKTLGELLLMQRGSVKIKNAKCKMQNAR